MTYISDIFQNLVRVVLSITFFDIIDILLLTYLVYMVIKLMKETRAEQLMKGILILVLMFMVVQVCQLKVMSFIFENFFQVGIIAIVVVFQPELRRILERVGRAKVPNISLGADSDVQSSRARDEAIAGIAEACERLHMTKTGALIVVERQTKIGDITEKATIINLPLYYYYPNRGSYILSSKEQFKIESLKTALMAAEAICTDNPEKAKAWEDKFISPFRSKLEKKLAKTKSC